MSRKIPGAAYRTSSARTAWRRRPRWIVCPSDPFLGNQKWRNSWREVWTVWRGTALDDWRMLLLAFSHVTCTRDHIAADSQLPRSCRNHSLLHTQRYCLRLARSTLRLVSFLTLPARFFLSALIKIKITREMFGCIQFSEYNYYRISLYLELYLDAT